MAGGSGTKIDPWIIETSAELKALLRTSGQGGYYRVAADLNVSFTATEGWSSAQAQAAQCKVIDLNGYKVSITSAQASGTYMIGGVFFMRGYLKAVIAAGGDYYYAQLFYNVLFEDVLLLADCNSGYGRSYLFASFTSNYVSLEPPAWRRLVIIGSESGASTVFDAGSISFWGTVREDVYKWTGTAGSWYSVTGGIPTPERLQVLAGDRFLAAGWYADSALGAGLARPDYSDLIEFVLRTEVAGSAVSRPLLFESAGQYTVLGESDALGELEVTLRVRRFQTLQVLATETFAVDRLQSGMYVVAGRWYLPPVDNGRRYQAGSSGQVQGVDVVSFSAAPVVINGVTFEPAPVYPDACSARTSMRTGGVQQIITLAPATGGGSGPAIEGDPAYLDGIVEEQHPTLGTIRPLANSEVAVFERRGDSFVAMGRALSNSIGEFRVETGVYGGGDVFCFAVDFPGTVWTPATELSIGMRVRPTVNNGYVYEVVSAGVSGATEPTWWPDAGGGTEGFIGTARAKARPYYQPVGDGPRKMTFV